jgi:hypothetical protein
MTKPMRLNVLKYKNRKLFLKAEACEADHREVRDIACQYIGSEELVRLVQLGYDVLIRDHQVIDYLERAENKRLLMEANGQEASSEYQVVLRNIQRAKGQVDITIKQLTSAYNRLKGLESLDGIKQKIRSDIQLPQVPESYAVRQTQA